MRYTRETRQQIVKDFAEQNGGMFDAALFLANVRIEGEAHPAFGWFEWNDDKAAHEYRLDQSRDFARGLVIKFEVEEIHRGKLRIAERNAPMVLSPLGGRRSGGGYVITDPADGEHMDELRRQAAQSLRWFISRYEAVLAHSGVNLPMLERMQALLEEVEHKEAA